MSFTRSIWVLVAALGLSLPAGANAQAGGPGEGDIFAKPSATPTPVEPNWNAPGGRGKGIMVFDPVGVGVDAEACQAVGDLLRSELTKLGRSVSPRSTMPAGSCAEEVCAAAAARAGGVPEAVITKLSRLNQKVMVITTLVDVDTGRAVYSDRIAAASLDDMDILTVRLARGVTTRLSLADTMTPDTVSEYDTHEQKRQRALFTTGVRVAGVLPVGGSYLGLTSLYEVDAVTYYEVRQYLIETALGYRGNTNDPTKRIGEGTLDLGGYYQFKNADISPFAGGGVGLHLLAAHYDGGVDKITGQITKRDDWGGAPNLWVGAGATILRATDVHVVGVIKYSIESFRTGDKPVQHGVMAGLAITYAHRTGSGGGGCCLW